MPGIRLYNTLTKQKEAFWPLGDTALIYGCGPTVYNYFHIGNARMFVVFDVLRRYLEYRGIKVKYVQNFTDVDDKIIRRAQSEGVSPEEIAERYIKEYFTDADGLNVRRADVHPRATESIPDMIAMIEKLIASGHAYERDGDVYFRTRSFPGYGGLSNQSVDGLDSGARIEVDDRKEDPLDFAMWKASKPGEPSWESPWGRGRPGWHIECSVMANRHLGKTIDIHGGGQDLAFPHHENEIAQSEAANGCRFARFWMHNGYINIDNRKMSKSLGNFFMTREAAKEYGYDVIRYFLIAAHYRTPVNFSEEIMRSAAAALERILTCYENLRFLAGADIPESLENDEEAATLIEGCRAAFVAAMDDDLNTADGLSAIFELVREVNTRSAEGRLSKTAARAASRMLLELTGVLGLRLEKEEAGEDGAVLALVEKRDAARKARDFKAADAIRDELKAMGITLEDTPAGVKIVRG